MTSTAVFSSLQAPAPEDNMDMSSPANATYDEDIDIIDFGNEDDPGADAGGVPLNDDEYMQEDGEQEPTEAVGDDMMEDDAQPAEATVQEQEMQDGFDPAAYEQIDPDDELIDYFENEVNDTTQVPDQISAESVPDVDIADQQPADDDFEQVDEEIVREPEIADLQQAPVLVEETFLSSQHTTAAPEASHSAVKDASVGVLADDEAFEARDMPQTDAATDGANADNSQEDPPANTDAQAAVPSSAEEHSAALEHPTNGSALANSVESRPESASASTGKLEIQVPAQLAHSASFEADAPGTPTDTGLHPVNLYFNGSGWPLFRSKNQPEGLLKDDNLASVGLAELLANCRQRVSLKTGEMISDDQEATLSFDSMGMEVSENHPACFSTSLSEVLDVYKQLCTNDLSPDDGADQIPALSITLSLHVKFASRLAGLKDAGFAGLGLSQCQPEIYDEEWNEGDDAYDGDARNGDVGFDEQVAEGHANNDLQEPAVAEHTNTVEASTYEDHGEHDQSGAGQDDAQDYNQEQFDCYDEAEYAATSEDVGDRDATEDQHAAAQAESKQNAGQHVADESFDPEAEAVLEADGAERPHGPQVTVVASSDFEATREQEVTNVTSGASSTTLRADDANVADGEYPDEDLIGYDELCLTGDSSELGQDEHGDFSTLYDESYNGDPEAQHQEDAQGPTGSSVGDNNDADAQDENDHNDAVAAHAEPAHEEYHDQALIERPVADLDEQDPSSENLPHESSAEGDAHQGETFEQGHETYPAQDQIDFTDEYAEPEAALDITEGPSLEHGPEQDANGDAVDLNNSHSLDKHDTQPDTGAAGTPDLSDEDSIDFDDDTEEQHEARKAAEQEAAAKTSASPLGKRSFDDTETATQDGEPEHKKPRPS